MSDSALTKVPGRLTSMITAVPVHIINQWGLTKGDRLHWKWEVIDGQMKMIVEPVRPGELNGRHGKGTNITTVFGRKFLKNNPKAKKNPS